ncbi:hypothetical protein SAMN05428964_105212 [Thalassospira xiamenensis]|uniref:Uncharacterized protein n=1 Tax=Thalassospira xiamenensis TaxID=220697 RepID=A0A285TX52_9PROT|nr:hypothetical protein SAMN05428964_105212 [Thalassospira xiamenensis]
MSIYIAYIFLLMTFIVMRRSDWWCYLSEIVISYGLALIALLASETAPIAFSNEAAHLTMFPKLIWFMLLSTAVFGCWIGLRSLLVRVKHLSV